MKWSRRRPAMMDSSKTRRGPVGRLSCRGPEYPGDAGFGSDHLLITACSISFTLIMCTDLFLEKSGNLRTGKSLGLDMADGYLSWPGFPRMEISSDWDSTGFLPSLFDGLGTWGLSCDRDLWTKNSLAPLGACWSPSIQCQGLELRSFCLSCVLIELISYRVNFNKR